MFTQLGGKTSLNVLQPLLGMTLMLIGFSAAAESCAIKGSCNIDVTFLGTFLAQTCDVSVNNGGESGTVVLPTVSSQLLQNSGDEVGSTQFPISLRNCPVSRTIEMRFTTSGGNTSDSETGNLVNSTGNDYSNDVQVRVRKIDGTQLSIDDNNSFQEYLIPASGDEVTHNFIASYYAKSNGAVSAGLVQTRSTIDLTYK